MKWNHLNTALCTLLIVAGIFIIILNHKWQEAIHTTVDLSPYYAKYDSLKVVNAVLLNEKHLTDSIFESELATLKKHSNEISKRTRNYTPDELRVRLERFESGTYNSR